MCAVQEPVGKWQEVEGDGGSGAKKGSNLLELFYADPKRCVPFSCPTGPLRFGRSPVPVDTCNLQSFQGECVMCLFQLSKCAVSLFHPTGGPIPFKPTLSWVACSRRQSFLPVTRTLMWYVWSAQCWLITTYLPRIVISRVIYSYFYSYYYCWLEFESGVHKNLIKKLIHLPMIIFHSNK